MRLLFKKISGQWRSVRAKIVSLPKISWILVFLAFILGILISSGRKSPEKESAPLHAHAEDQETKLWTCSMHPQIKLSEPGQCPICFMDLIPLAPSGEDVGLTELKMSEEAIKLAEIQTVIVRKQNGEAQIRLSGTITIDETRMSKITAWVPGRIEKLYVNFTGIEIKKGNPLAELYSPELYSAQEELLQSINYFTHVEKSQSSYTSMEMTLNAAREKLRQLGLSEEQVQEIENRGTASDRIRILSPSSGIVIRKNVVEGDYVSRGSQIFNIADLSRVWVTLDAYESDLSLFKKGQKVHLTIEAFPGMPFKGEVVFINPVVNERTRTTMVRLNIDNSKGLLKPGMFVHGDVHVPRGKETGGYSSIQIPVSAVLRTGKRAIVYVKKPYTEEPVFEGREIALGPRLGDFYVVISGLQEGEEVVIKGNFKIDSAMQIAAKSSMMSPVGNVPEGGHAHHELQASALQDRHVTNERNQTQFDSEKEFIESLTPVYKTYLKAQEALASDDFRTAQNALIMLNKQILSIIENIQDNRAEAIWSKHKRLILNQTQHARHWVDIEAARNAFKPISASILTLIHTFGFSGIDSYYEVFCPMAFDNQGAYWIQDHEIIDNPYFGSAMLRCGEVKNIIKPRK